MKTERLSHDQPVDNVPRIGIAYFADSPEPGSGGPQGPGTVPFADRLIVISRVPEVIRERPSQVDALPPVDLIPCAGHDHDDCFQRALAAARKSVDYLLWLGVGWRSSDAVFFEKRDLSHDAYRVRCHAGAGSATWRIGLIRCERQWCYDPDRDEPVATDPDSAFPALSTIKFVDGLPKERRDLLRAIRIGMLHDGHASNPDNPTIAFRLGVHYQRLGDDTTARDWFEQRAREPSGDAVERAIALHYVALYLKYSGASWERLEPAFHRAFDLCPDRAEPLFEIIRHYRNAGRWQDAMALSDVAESILPPRDGHEFDPSVYEWKLPYERMLCAWQLKRHELVIECANRVLQFYGLPPEVDGEAARFRRRALDYVRPVYPVASGRRNRIKVIVPFYNAGAYLRSCVESLHRQDYTNFHVYIVDDASTDGGTDGLDLDSRFTLVSNADRVGAMSNYVRMLMEFCEADDIAVFVDGDDALACDDALSYINDIYNRTGCWVMYGQFASDHRSISHARPIESAESIEDLFGRKQFRFPIHVRTHRAGLLHRIAEQDPGFTCLKEADGRYFSGMEDVAHMRAIFMAAGKENIYYNDRVLYRYTTSNPLSAFRADRDAQFRACARASAARRISPVASWRDEPRHSHGIASAKTRLLVVSLEGMDPAAMTRWMKQGFLPNLAKLAECGSCVPLEVQGGTATADTFSASAWTGTNPGAHGKFWPICFDESGYERVWNLHPMPATPVWTVLSRAGLHSMVMNQYEMPVSREVNVTSLQNWAIHAPRHPLESHPDSLKEDLLSRFDPEYRVVFTERKTPMSEDEFLVLGRELQRRLEVKSNAYEHYLQWGRWDLYQVGFDEAHDASHQMWHVHDEEHVAHRADWLGKHGDPLLEIYRKLDAATGRLIDAAGDAAAMVVVGPGMGRTVLCSNQLDDMLLAFEAHYLGSAFDSRSGLANRRFYPQDFSLRVGAVRLNVAGREAMGFVKPGEEYDALCARLTNDFMALRIPGTNEPAVDRVVKSSDVFHGARLDVLPDLLVVWRSDREVPAVESPVFGVIRIRKLENDCLSERTGDHTGHGMLISSVPLDYRGDEPLRVETVAPTIAGYFGIDMPDAEVPGLRAAGIPSADTKGRATFG